MLLPHQVLPFLENESAPVRDHAAEYFYRAHDPATATADDFWRSIDRYGFEASRVLLFHLRDMPQTEQSLRRTLDALRAGAPDEADYQLQLAVENVDFPLLEAHREELLAFEHVAPRVRDHLSRRLELAGVPAGELWDRLLQVSRRMDDEQDDPLDEDVAGALVEALARHGDAAGRAMGRLRDGPKDDWMELFSVQLLGRLRHEPAIGLLIEGLHVDDDWMPENVVDALTRIGTPDIVRQLEAFYPGKPWHVRLFADDPLARIKRTESEAALLRLLEIEQEPDLTGNLAAGLCELCTTDGLEAVRRVILEKRYDPKMEDLEELLLVTGAIVGYEPPEAAEWRERLARQEAERNRSDAGLRQLQGWLAEDRDRWRRGESAPVGPRAGGESDEFDDEAAGAWEPSGDPGWKSLLPEDPPPGTFRRETPKVGRNDPCPCGSGKKYKKCCLKGNEFAV